MPARKRKKPGGVEPQPDLSTRGGRKQAQASAAEVFAERQKAERKRQSDEAKARRAAREDADRRRRLTQEKDRAAERLKDVRRRGAPGAARVEAEAAYRAALDALLRDEQGLPPLAEGEDPAEAAAADAAEGERSSEDAPVEDVPATD